MIKVLSIDWDVFFDMTKFIPGSCGRLAPAWAFMYRAFSDGFACEFKFAYEEFERTKAFLSNYDKVVYTARDHHDIVKVLPRNETIELTNLDFHHDMAKHLPHYELDPGNWMSYAKQNLNCDISLKWYQLATKDKFDSGDYEKVLNRLDGIECQHFLGFNDDLFEVDYDIVFICQSPDWSPPHMNHRLKELLECPKHTEYLNDNIYRTFLEEIEIIKSEIATVYIIEECTLVQSAWDELFDGEDGQTDYIIISKDVALLNSVKDVDPFYRGQMAEDFETSNSF